VSTASKHLDPDEIHWLLESETETESISSASEALEQAREHLNVCEACRRMFRLHEKTVRELRGLPLPDVGAGEECRSIDELRRLAAGMLEETEADVALEHASRCKSCGTALREASIDFKDEVSPMEGEILGALESAREGWQTRLGQTLSEASHPARTTRSWWTYAAAVLAAAVGFWLLRGAREPELDELLAQAYTEQRTLELRLSGAEYAPLRRERAAERSSLSKPAALLKAEYIIRERLTAGKLDVDLLEAKGRAEILEWQYDDAISSLTNALDLSPSGLRIQRDLAAAHFQRAEMEQRPTDYGMAAEYLGKVLAIDPDDEVALFNRAIVYERLFLFNEAERDWEAYLAAHPSGEWAAEARGRLLELRRTLKRGSEGASVLPDPEQAIRRFQTRSSTDWPDFLDEEYLDTAVKAWLPASPESSPERPALRALARALEAHHRDWWLSDVLSTPASLGIALGWSDLSAAAVANTEGRHDIAADAALRAKSRFEATGCRACALRAGWELAYALQRRQDGARCRKEAESALEALPQGRYPWVHAQLLIELAACAHMIGDMETASRESQRAETIARTADYPSLHLRTLQFAGVETAREDPERSWLYFQDGLKLHWKGSYRPFRAYQFYAEMAYAAESEEKWHLARALARESVVHVARSPNRLVEAIARHSLAVDSGMAGDAKEARREFDRAREIFSSLPPSPTTRTFQFSADVYQASLESRAGFVERALERLQAGRRNPADVSQYWVWLHYYQTLGEALLHQGNLGEADRALRSALHISEGAFASIASDLDRLSWERQTSRAYRAFVELHLLRGDEETSLEVWEWYRAATTRGAEAFRERAPIAFDVLEEGPAVPRMEIVRARLPSLDRATIVSYADLPGGLAAWAFDDRGIVFRRLAVASEKLGRAARVFARLCADPDSDVIELRTAGRELYEWLLAPFEERLEKTRTLVVESDGALSSIPFQALVNSREEYVGELAEVVYSPGLAFSTDHELSRFTKDDRALIVGTAAPPGELGSRLAPVAEAESEARLIAAQLSSPTLLLGKEATAARLQRELPGAGVFHFAGHAISTPSRKGLLLASSDGDPDRGTSAAFLDAARFAELRLEGTRLVVLSACRTAADERGLVDPLSLVRAFLVAGAGDVVASRWNVDSASTASLMERFYRMLGAGSLPTAALQAAAAELREAAHTSHPYYWAAFSVYGRS
jgi:tetratricopeptide (TPR) repeat protein